MLLLVGVREVVPVSATDVSSKIVPGESPANFSARQPPDEESRAHQSKEIGGFTILGQPTCSHSLKANLPLLPGQSDDCASSTVEL